MASHDKLPQRNELKKIKISTKFYYFIFSRHNFKNMRNADYSVFISDFLLPFLLYVQPAQGVVISGE